MAETKASEPVRPIIVIKKKAAHGGHHGGAWKVAYADFVTAMMALFIVLWLMSCSQEIKQAVGGYFIDPKGQGKQAGSSIAGQGESLALKKDQLNRVKDRLQQAIKELPGFQKLKDNVKMTVTGEGLRIELLEGENGTFFESGKPQPSPEGVEMLETLAHELGEMPNKLVIEGHTDAKAFPRDGYTNWELSADRANAARRLMQQDGLRADQVMEVRGFADQDLRIAEKPFDASNRRVSVIVHYRDALPAATKQPAVKPAKS